MAEPQGNEVKVTLHDGVKPVNSITIFAMFRNNGPYLEFFFKALEDWQAYYAASFKYYFIENDSTDDTREKLQKWMADKPGKLILGEFENDYVNKGENFERCERLAYLRNTLVEAATPLDSDWTVFLDSHIFFNKDTLEKMFRIAQPAANNIGMMTCNSRQVYTLGVLKKWFGDKVKVGDDNDSPDRRICLRHSFDTFTLFNKAGYSYHPYCPFQGCRLCPLTREARAGKKEAIEVYDPKEAVIDVQAAFGGLGVIESSILNHPRIRWGTLSFDGTRDMSLSDHVLFCDRLTTVTGKRVVLLQETNDVYRTW